MVTETYPPEVNGVAHTMRHLAEGLAARGHQVHLVRPRQPADRSEPDHRESRAPCAETLIPGLPIPGYRGLRFGLPVYRRLRRLWHRDRPEVVYIATQGPLGHAALSTGRALGIPTVTGFHTHFEQYSRYYGLGLLTTPITAMLRRFHNGSDATVVPTADLKSELERAGFANVAVFGRGVDLDLFSPMRRDPALREAWGCGPVDLVVAYVGRIAAEKNLGLLLETSSAIAAEQPGARLLLVGDGPELAAIERDHPQHLCVGMRLGEVVTARRALEANSEAMATQSK